VAEVTPEPDEVVLSAEERSILGGLAILACQADLVRFDKVERVVHWVNATLFAVVMATAACLYIPTVSAMVGRREAVKTIHVYAGLLLPFPLVIGVIGRRWGHRLRGDLRRLNRWIADDAEWLRRRQWLRGRSGRGVRLGKFNPGQKLNAAFTGGAIILMLATGSIMRWYKPWPLRWRTGATFVHDWVAIGLFLSITGHIMFALRDPDSLRSMRVGTISRAWARRNAPRWLDELDEVDEVEEDAGSREPSPRE
jgi:cytochrome b subunit of formate dehydrogenase